MIELKRNPLGAPVRQSRGIVPLRLKNDATSLTDKLRIANKVNNKYSESLTEKLKLLEELEKEVGPENLNELLNPNKNGILSSGNTFILRASEDFHPIPDVIVGSNLCNTISSS